LLRTKFRGEDKERGEEGISFENFLEDEGKKTGKRVCSLGNPGRKSRKNGRKLRWVCKSAGKKELLRENAVGKLYLEEMQQRGEKKGGGKGFKRVLRENIAKKDTDL